MKFFPILAVLLMPLALPSSAEAAPSPETSILRVNITSQGYNFALPWQKQRPNTRRGLGALLEGNRVLVTAELAQDANYIELNRPLPANVSRPKSRQSITRSIWPPSSRMRTRGISSKAWSRCPWIPG